MIANNMEIINYYKRITLIILIVSKILEISIKRRLLSFDKHYYFWSNQFGFRSNSISTIDPLTKTSHIILASN